jgi:hypothetical protein
MQVPGEGRSSIRAQFQLGRDIAQRMWLMNSRDFLKRVSNSAEMKRSRKRFWLEHSHAAVARLDETRKALAVIKAIITVPPGNRARIGRALLELEAFPKVCPLGLYFFTLAAVRVLKARGSGFIVTIVVNFNALVVRPGISVKTFAVIKAIVTLPVRLAEGVGGTMEIIAADVRLLGTLTNTLVARLDETRKALAVIKAIVTVPPGNRARIGGAMSKIEALGDMTPSGVNRTTL